MRGASRALLALLAPIVAGCEFDKTSIPATDARVALHAVLSASAESQVVLLERTRNGTVQMFAPPFDVTDAVMSDEGIAESFAHVALTLPDGSALVAIEARQVRDDGKGAGIYRIYLPGVHLPRNQSFRLTVLTQRGEVLAAETRVPAGAPAERATEREFDRAADTIALAWPAAPGARSYLVRVETPYGPRTFFTDSTRVRLPGMLRNADTDELHRVFIPGFQQAVTVSAVDTNFYDWYRTNNDIFTGAGLINRVTGGIGLFGALVRLRFEQLHVTGPQTEPAAGRWDFAGTPEERATAPFLAFELYVESKSARTDQADALSGRYHRRPSFANPGCLLCGVLGSVRGGRVELQILRDWYASDTSETFTGELRGDTLVGSYHGAGGVARFVRRR